MGLSCFFTSPTHLCKLDIKQENQKECEIQGNIIDGVSNLSPSPFPNCDSYHAGASLENEAKEQAGNILSISVAAVPGFADSAQLSVIKKILS